MSLARIAADGVFHYAGGRYRAALGAGGIRERKAEGDGATPAGVLMLRRVLYRADRGVRPRAAVPVALLGPGDGWCDDPLEGAYNRMVQLPFSGGHEAFWREDAVYDVVGVLGWNDAPVVKGVGSAIFLHVARADYAPTEGCVALARGDLMAVLAGGLTGVEVVF